MRIACCGDFDLDAVAVFFWLAAVSFAHIYTGHQETGCDAPLVFHLRALFGGVRNEFSATLLRRLKRHFYSFGVSLWSSAVTASVLCMYTKVHNNEPWERLVRVMYSEGGVGIAAQGIRIGAAAAFRSTQQTMGGARIMNFANKRSACCAHSQCVKRNAAIYINIHIFK